MAVVGVMAVVLLTLSVAACGTGTGQKTTTKAGFPMTNGVAGGAAALAFSTQPAQGISGVPFTPPLAVTVEDSSGKIVANSAAAVSLFFTTSSNTGGATLSGNTTVNAVNGVATFSDISIDKAGSYYSLTAASPGLASVISDTFPVKPGKPTKLVFVTQPVAAAAGAAFSTQPVLAIEDAQGNVVTDSTAPVTLTIQPGTGTEGAVLTGTTTTNAVNGRASFATISINMAGDDYVVTAESPGLTPVSSNSLFVG